MAKMKVGDVFCCDGCGLIVEVRDPCTCDACDLICCEMPMKKKEEQPESSEESPSSQASGPCCG